MSIADKLTLVAENEKKVYDAGYQAQYDLFWDTIQQKGARTDYEKAFCGWRYADDIFKPKYDIKPETALQMFHRFQTHISLPDVCAEQGIVMDFSQATTIQDWLYNSAIYRVGVIDCSSIQGAIVYPFNCASSLTTIDKWIVHEGITSYTHPFANSVLLKNITIEGVINGNGIYVNTHKNLTHESLFGKVVTEKETANLPSTNVLLFNGEYYYGGFILALKDYSGTSTTKTLTLGTENLAKLTDAEKAIATERGWTLV